LGEKFSKSAMEKDNKRALTKKKTFMKNAEVDLD